MPKLIIVSNRLPVKVKKGSKGLQYEQSSGGLATGLKSFYKSYDSIWIGWPGLPVEELEDSKKNIKEKLNDEFNCEPLFLTRYEIENYYLGYSNKTIWPLCHYFTQFVNYDKKLWQVYKKVNQKFANKIAEFADEDDIVWVHDYHLMLLPKLIREKIKNISIGYFHHIPFPSYEIFRLLPSRIELMEGLMGANLVGFHTYDYMRHFQSSAQRLLGYESQLGRIDYEDRTVKVDSFPMGIDFDKFSNASKDSEVKNEINILKKKMMNQRVVLSIDRLDYTKGILQRLKAYNIFLRNNPQCKEKIKFIVVTAPSREEVEQYNQLKERTERLVSQINGEHGVLGWMPIWYLHKTFNFKNLVALYNISDIYVVTPLRDGMNLMAKEYLAARNDKKGVLILSEMAGAYKELGETFIVNPNNISSIVDSLEKAMDLSDDKKEEINSIMRERLKRYNVVRWAEDFFQKLNKMRELEQKRESNLLTEDIQNKIINDYKKSQKRLILIDYDGAFTPYCEGEIVEPSQDTIDTLENLTQDERNEFVIFSQAERSEMDKCFRNLDTNFVADQGAYLKRKNQDWEKLDMFDTEWKSDLLPVFELFVDRTPGSTLIEKEFSIIWDYSDASFDLGELRARELINELMGVTGNMDLQILEKENRIELRASGLSKEHAALRWLANEKWDFVLAVSDGLAGKTFYDHLPEKSYSIKIGKPETKSKYYVKSPEVIIDFLKKLI
ncbi:MAG: bifunctional alpha,alpha-trehalose-phosphate synthase (UDP-forming)/trehalose-phosphatase [Candidatus Cloacimonetes bacterium]|nr:bifunctional alpha,alpha-trehalose-phosphate synthase (UDP-forming)/trehalose-phosphatase [Candidatus Cloacimonadota bacterium]MBS3767581.1 bifunctional alpha,alpha-trehalose-phosphate synthase (UDP-forming)/trehalose-phosphatase [Candidatus Cloacimonadota bacterium]